MKDITENNNKYEINNIIETNTIIFNSYIELQSYCKGTIEHLITKIITFYCVLYSYSLTNNTDYSKTIREQFVEFVKLNKTICFTALISIIMSIPCKNNNTNSILLSIISRKIYILYFYSFVHKDLNVIENILNQQLFSNYSNYMKQMITSTKSYDIYKAIFRLL